MVRLLKIPFGNSSKRNNRPQVFCHKNADLWLNLTVVQSDFDEMLSQLSFKACKLIGELELTEISDIRLVKDKRNRASCFIAKHVPTFTLKSTLFLSVEQTMEVIKAFATAIK